MPYYSLGQDPTQPQQPPQIIEVPAEVVEEPAPLTEEERAAIQAEAKAVIEQPMPPPKEVAVGTEETRKASGPTKEEIDYVYRAVRDYIGDAVLDELSYRMGKIMRSFGRDVQKGMITTAAVDTGVSIGLMCIPVVGWIASAIYSIVMAVVRGLTGPALQREAQMIIANAQQEAAAMETIFDAKLRDTQAQIIREETPAAVKLALSIALGDNVPVAGAPAEGLGNIALALQMFAVAKEREFQQQLQTMTPEEQAAAKAQKQAQMAAATALWIGTSPQLQQNITKTFQNTVESLQEAIGQKEPEESTWDKVKSSVKADGIIALATGGAIPPGALTIATLHPDARIQALAVDAAGKTIAWQKGGMDYISGHIIVTKAKEAARLLLEHVRLRLMAQVAITKAQMDDPDYRANLRMAMAQQMLNEPSIRQMLIATVQARQNIGQALQQPEQVGIKKTNPKTKILIGGGLAAAVAAYFFLS